MKFTPKFDFSSEELVSNYLAGLTYTVRQKDSLLAKLVQQWIEEGKVEVLEDRPPASLSGRGVIS